MSERLLNGLVGLLAILSGGVTATVYMSDHFVPKDDFRELKLEISKKLDKIDDKIDRVLIKR